MNLSLLFLRRVAFAVTTTEKWNSILGPLHFGYYGSPLVKWLFVIGGLMPAVLACSGTAIWLLRRHRSKAFCRAAHV